MAEMAIETKVLEDTKLSMQWSTRLRGIWLAICLVRKAGSNSEYNYRVMRYNTLAVCIGYINYIIFNNLVLYLYILQAIKEIKLFNKIVLLLISS